MKFDIKPLRRVIYMEAEQKALKDLYKQWIDLGDKSRFTNKYGPE